MTQKLFPHRGGECLREARMIFQHPGPDLGSFEQGRAEAEQYREKNDAIITHIEGVRTRSGDEDLRKKIHEKPFRNMVAAQVGFPAGPNLQWQNPLTAVFAQKFNEAFEGAKHEIESLHKKTNDRANKFNKAVDSAGKDVKSAREQYNKHNAPGAAQDKLPFGDKLDSLLDAVPSEAALIARFSAAIDLMHAITQATDDAAKINQSVNALKPELQKRLTGTRGFKFGEQTHEENRLDTLFTALDSACFRPSAGKKPKEQMHSVLLDYVANIVTDAYADTKPVLDVALTETEQKISEEKRDQSGHIQERFGARIRYLNRLGGTDVGALIALSIDEDGKFAENFLKNRIQIIRGQEGKNMPDLDDAALVKALALTSPLVGDPTDKNAELQKRCKEVQTKYGIDETQLKPLLSALLNGGWTKYVAVVNVYAPALVKKKELTDKNNQKEILGDIIGTWNTSAAEECIGRIAGKNPIGFSISRLSERARLPVKVSDTLGTTSLGVSASTLLALAQADQVQDATNKKLDPKVADKMAEWMIVKDKHGEAMLRSRDVLVEALTLVFFKDKTAEGAQTAQDLAEKKADAWLKNIASVGIFTHKGDEQYGVNKDSLITELKKTGGFVAAFAGTDLLKEVKDAGIKDTWDDLVKKHMGEGWKLTKAGGNLWLEYFQSLPRNFWDGKDADLLVILDREAGLERYAEAIRSLRKAFEMPEEGAKASAQSIGNLKTKQEQAFKPIGISASPWDHAAGAEALVRANLYVRGRLQRQFNWDGRTLKERLTSLWLGMHKGTKEAPDAGIELAGTYLRGSDSAAAAGGLDSYTSTFVTKNLRLDEREGYEEFLARYGILEARRDRLEPLRTEGISLKADAPGILRTNGRIANVGRWLRDLTPEKTADDIALILEDTPGSRALLFVLRTGNEASYDVAGVSHVIKPVDARLIVLDLKVALEYRVRSVPRTIESLKEEDRYGNPVERWARTGVETLKELWSGDWVNKAEVVAIVAAGTWLIYTTWKKGGMAGKAILVGIPLLMGANAVYRNKTGRDLLGEKLSWRSKEERATPMEGFRDRAGALVDRFRVLAQPSGDAAIGELMRPGAASVADLLKWRGTVLASPLHDPTSGRPSGLKVGGILEHLGSDAGNKEACGVALTAFEALCADVAALRKLGGANTEDLVSRGADYIAGKYASGKTRADGKPFTMLDVLIGECPVAAEEATTDRRFLEYCSDVGGVGVGAIGTWLRRGLGHVDLVARQGAHWVPEVAGEAKEWVTASADDVWNWARATKVKLWAEGKGEIVAGWNLISGTLSEAGIILVREGPKFCKWTVDKAVEGAGVGKYVALSAIHKLRKNGVIGPVLDWVIDQFNDFFGLNIKKEWFTEEYLQEIAKYKKFKKTLIDRVQRFATVKEDFGGKMDKWMKELTGEDPTKDLPPRQRLLAQDVVEKRVFCRLAAERMHQIDNKMGDKDYKGVVIPLTINTWQDKLEDIGKDADGKDDKVFEYLVAHYRPEIVLPLIGNELTFVGTMERWRKNNPKLPRATFAEILLSPGFLQAVTRDSAVEFMPHEVQAYIAPYAEKAQELKERGTINEEQRDAYLSFLDCLATNAAFEAILAEGSGAKDLVLTKGIAKTLHARLMESRGIAPQMKLDEIFKGNNPLGNLITEQFKSSDSPPPIPAEITNVTGDKRGNWLLTGKEPIDEEEKKKDDAAGKATSGSPVAAKDEEVEKSKTQKVPEDMTALVKLLGQTNVPDKTAIRSKFDAAKAAHDKGFITDSNSDDAKKATEFFLGYTEANAKESGEKLLKSLENEQTPQECNSASKWLLQNVGALRKEYPGHPRFQRLLDQAAMQMLVHTAEEIVNVDTEKLETHNNKTIWESTLFNLYRLSAEASDDKFKDGVSQLLEYMHCKGNFSKDAYQKYVQYLKDAQLTAPTFARTLPVRNPFSQWDNTDCQLRFSNTRPQDKQYVQRIINGFGNVTAAQPLLQEAKMKGWD